MRHITIQQVSHLAPTIFRPSTKDTLIGCKVPLRSPEFKNISTPIRSVIELIEQLSGLIERLSCMQSELCADWIIENKVRHFTLSTTLTTHDTMTTAIMAMAMTDIPHSIKNGAAATSIADVIITENGIIFIRGIDLWIEYQPHLIVSLLKKLREGLRIILCAANGNQRKVQVITESEVHP